MNPPERFREAYANRVQALINKDTLRNSLQLADTEYVEADEEMAAARIALITWVLDNGEKAL